MDAAELVIEVKKNKKYKNISEDIVKAKVEEYISRNPIFDEKIAVKEIRKELHRAHGSFRGEAKKLGEYILKKDWENVLRANKSTAERLANYDEIYQKIFEITGKPNSVLDLGCGLNPVSIPFMKLEKDFEYYGCDINEAEIVALNDFFKVGGINGKAEALDLSDIENVRKLREADLCFMFKLVDILEKDGHKYAEEMIKILADKTRFIVVSFATRTLSGKKMKFAERGWIERMLARIEMKFEKLVFENEIFYVISKK